MTTWQQVVDAHRANPTWNSEEIARHLGCIGGYVRAVARRRGFKFPRRPAKRKPPKKPRKENLYSLGKAARAAGLTIAMLNEIAAENAGAEA